MDRIIRQITEYFVSQLPNGKKYYRIEDLPNYDFPTFLVRRIHIELQWNLDESMMLPETDWANTQSEAVQQSWKNFLKAIHAEVKLPASYAKAVVETAVTDIIDMLVQPRKNITDILFGGEDTLSASDIEERTELLVVYPHFAQVLTSYMQRKDKGQLTRSRCKDIIKRVDERVTYQYTPLQWAQMLDPLFTLAGPELDSSLLRLFFEDRNLAPSARRFEKMGKAVSRAEFIEVLSSPELLNYESHKGNQSRPLDETRQDEIEEENEGLEESVQEEEPEQSVGEEAPLVAEDKWTDDTGPSMDVGDEALEVPAKKDDTQSEDEDQPVQPERNFEDRSDLSGGEEYGQEKQDEDQLSALNDIFVSPDDEPNGEQGTGGAPSIDHSETVEEAKPQDEDEESPIWMRYMDSDESEERGTQEEVDASHEEEGDDEAVINRPENNEDEQQELAERLQDDRFYFVDELFNGSEQSYQEALYEIAQKDSWKEASELIKQNIFERNQINIYSEAAVDFTDRLHGYFMDKENSNEF